MRCPCVCGRDPGGPLTRASPKPRRPEKALPASSPAWRRSTSRLPQICKCSAEDHNGMRGTYPGPAAAHGDVFLPMNRIAADLARVGVVAALPLRAEIGVDGHLRSGRAALPQPEWSLCWRRRRSHRASLPERTRGHTQRHQGWSPKLSPRQTTGHLPGRAG